ncbi:MAG: PKD domain-containing protein [Bacteroidia bacterium]
MRQLFTYVLWCMLWTATCFSQQKTTKELSVQNLPPDVHYSWENTCPGDTVCFINQSLMADTYTWTVIAPGGKSHTVLDTTSATDFCFHFPGPGTYTISLLAYNNHYVTLTQVLTIDTITKASFDFISCVNQFPNTSLCATSFQWDFGDGHTSSAFSPSHQYADTGFYKVRLVAYNGSKSDTLSKIIHINVLSYADPSFTYSISYDTVFVHATPAGSQTGYFWNFNDPLDPSASLGSGKDTLHVYKDSTAAYEIDLTVVNACGPKFKADSVRIVIPKVPPNLSFTSNLAILPNPVENGTLNIFYNSFTNADFLAVIYDPLGRLMTEEYFTFQQGINGFQMDVSRFSEGVYVLNLISENTYVRRKFIVRK